MSAVIRSEISGKPTLEGVSRDDLEAGNTVTLTSVNSAGDYEWELVYVPPGSSAALSDPTGASTSFTVDEPGPYLARLRVDGGASEQYVRLRRETSLGLRLVASGERIESALAIPVDLDASGWTNDQNRNLLLLEDAIGTPTTPMLSSVLVEGNLTGGSDILLSSGDAVRGEGGAGLAAPLTLLGGTASSGDVNGGHVILRPGEGSGTGDGGFVEFQSPDSSHTLRVDVQSDGVLLLGAGASMPLVLDATEGSLHAPGQLLSPLWRAAESPAPTTSSDQGAIFVSDGTGGLTKNRPYFRPENNGTPVDLLASGGGGGGTSIQHVFIAKLPEFDPIPENYSEISGFVSFEDPFDLTVLNIPSGTPYIMLQEAYGTWGLTARQCNSDWFPGNNTLYWSIDTDGREAEVPDNPGESLPRAGLAANGGSNEGARAPVIPVSGSSTGYYFEVEAKSAMPDCFRVGLFDFRAGRQICDVDLIGGPSPAGDVSEDIGVTSVAYQSDGTVYTGDTTPTDQFNDPTPLTDGDRVGVLLEFVGFDTFNFFSVFGMSNDFAVRVYFYHHDGGTGKWLNDANPETGRGAVNLIGQVAQGSFTFGDGTSTTAGDTFTVDDGSGNTVVFEWIPVSGTPSGSNVGVEFDPGDTAEDMRDHALAALTQEILSDELLVAVLPGGSTDTVIVRAVQAGTSWNGAGPVGATAPTTFESFDGGMGGDPTQFYHGFAISNDIRAKVDFSLEGTAGNYLVVENTVTGYREYLSIDAFYTSEFVVGEDNDGVGSEATLTVGSTPLTMTAVADSPDPEEFEIAGTPEGTASNLVAAINSSGVWNVLVKAEVDPVNGRMVVIKPADALGDELDISLHAHTAIGTTGSLFESAVRTNIVSTGQGQAISTGINGISNRFGANTTKGERLLFAVQRTSSDVDSNSPTLYAYPAGPAGNGISVTAYPGDGTSTSIGSGGGSLSGGQPFPSVELVPGPAGAWVCDDLPSFVEPWLELDFDALLPLDTMVLSMFGMDVSNLNLQWEGAIPLNPTGIGRSAEIRMNDLTTTGDIEIDYLRADRVSGEGVAETLTLSGPFTGETSTHFLNVPIFRIDAVRAQVTGGGFSIVVGDLWAPSQAPWGTVSGVAAAAPLVSNPPPTILVQDHTAKTYYVQPEIGGDDGNMINLYSQVAGSEPFPAIPSGAPQRSVVQVSLHYEVSNT